MKKIILIPVIFFLQGCMLYNLNRFYDEVQKMDDTELLTNYKNCCCACDGICCAIKHYQKSPGFNFGFINNHHDYNHDNGWQTLCLKLHELEKKKEFLKQEIRRRGLSLKTKNYQDDLAASTQ